MDQTKRENERKCSFCLDLIFFSNQLCISRYQLATRLSDRLDDMGKDLSSMIEEINDASSNLSKHAKSDDPLTQVVRVLNGHLTQLQEIDQGAASLQLKVKEAQKVGQNIRPSNGLNGPSSDAAEAFYRSFMGR